MFQLKGVQYKNILDIDALLIPDKKITCIVGESGSGKTTLLRLLNKMISCTSGEIYYKGNAISEMNAIQLRREIITLPQSPAIFTGTVRENLLIGLRFSEKQPANDEKLTEVLAMVRLNKSLEDNADKLSGGEKQRLCLGRMILMEPSAFLLDEPSSALDEDTERIIIQQLVHHTRQTSKTMIMVTHSKSIAQTFADNIVEIKNGQVLNQEVYSVG